MDTQHKKRNIAIYIPLILVIGLSILFGHRLISGANEKALPSNLIEKSAPSLTLEKLEGSQRGNIQTNSLDGKVSLVNIWASWCGPCRLEHPIIVDLKAQKPDLQIVGINIRDKKDNALAFLNELGNPYDLIGIDPKGRSMVEWGGYGVPETFIVNKEGIIVYKHVGPINETIMKKTIMPLINTLM